MENNRDRYNLAQLQLTATATMVDAIRAIDSGNVQIALVVDHSGRLIGTITDGDIRRAILRGEATDAPVDRIMHRDFSALPANATEAEALAVMRREVLHQVPALDETGKVIRLFLMEDLIQPACRPNAVVIMAGGEGKRLRPLTNDCPKPMLRVGDRPLLEIIIEQSAAAGFQKYYLAVNYLKEQIQDYFCDGARWNVEINYLEEDKPLGTAGALNLLPEMPNEPFLVINGDVLTRIDYGRLLRFHQEQAASATLCVRNHATQIPYGVVQMDDLSVCSLEEKPTLSHHVNAGIYLLDPTLLALVPKNTFYDMPDLLMQALHQEKKVSAFPIHEYWLDVGHPHALNRATAEWR
ncbi:MAG: alcohol dehydrogenase [Rhodobacteraceae bacterium]|nr:alcohol dehydrogenase [Paracoccaceae bacterium]